MLKGGFFMNTLYKQHSRTRPLSLPTMEWHQSFPFPTLWTVSVAITMDGSTERESLAALPRSTLTLPNNS